MLFFFKAKFQVLSLTVHQLPFLHPFLSPSFPPPLLPYLICPSFPPGWHQTSFAVLFDLWIYKISREVRTYTWVAVRHMWKCTSWAPLTDLFGGCCWSLGVHGSKAEKHWRWQLSWPSMIVMSVFFGASVSQTSWRFLLCLCACMYKYITETHELYDSYLSFTKIAGSLWYCWGTLYLVHLDIIVSGINWIINKNLQVLIQELLMAQIFNPSPCIQNVITLVIRQVIATCESLSDGWLGTETKTLFLPALLGIPRCHLYLFNL